MEKENHLFRAYRIGTENQIFRVYHMQKENHLIRVCHMEKENQQFINVPYRRKKPIYKK